MSRMSCRNGLVWQGRRARFVFVAAICLGLMVTSARGGDLNPPAGPDNMNSAMWTLKDIYDVLDTRTTNVTKRTAFREPTAGPTNGTMHNLNEIMTLVTNRAPVEKTGQTPTLPSCTPNPATSDGNLQIGVAWPNPRFSPVATNGAETNQIRDNLTGLIWARNANIAGTKTWTNAFDAITNLVSGVVNKVNYGGTNDWRLPNVRELHSLVTFQYYNPALSDGTGTNQWTEGNPFTDVQSGYYWSSTTRAAVTNQACYVGLNGSKVEADEKTLTYYVWPVRGGR